MTTKPAVKLKNYYPMFIGGQFVDSQSGERMTVYNPATGEAITEVAKGKKEDVDRAVQTARQAFDHSRWPTTPFNKRARLLINIAQEMRKRFDELVKLEVLNTGKTLSAAQGQIQQAIEDFEFFAGAIVSTTGETKPVPPGFFNYTQKEPVGVCAQIIPWNYPLMMAAWKIAPALAAGCTIVLKPASLTPLTALVLAEICQAAGVPDGVLNVITGPGAEIGSYLVEHPGVDKVAFTGETVTGKEIMKKAAGTLKRVTLELGGKSPNIVFEDADLEAAANGALYGIYYNSGQSCEARSRLFVQESIYEPFLNLLVEKVKKIKLGDPFAEDTHLGAIISQGQLNTIHQYVREAVREGAKVVFGGDTAKPEGFENGYWYMPTILAEVTNDMKVVQEEIFGPVVVVMPFKNEQEVVQLANDTIYGLAGAVWTNDFAKAHRVAGAIRAGILMINSPFSTFPGLPFGGYKQSGFGRELALETMDLYTETKSVLAYIGTKTLNPFQL